MGFALFETPAMAMAAKDALQVSYFATGFADLFLMQLGLYGMLELPDVESRF